MRADSQPSSDKDQLTWARWVAPSSTECLYSLVSPHAFRIFCSCGAAEYTHLDHLFSFKHTTSRKAREDIKLDTTTCERALEKSGPCSWTDFLEKEGTVPIPQKVKEMRFSLSMFCITCYFLKVLCGKLIKGGNFSFDVFLLGIFWF